LSGYDHAVGVVSARLPNLAFNVEIVQESESRIHIFKTTNPDEPVGIIFHLVLLK
jgi:hypothetical protein